ncbi:MAG TPA: YdeI/OmpD-associated family protein [Pyrinomonadaceae bacterium]
MATKKAATKKAAAKKTAAKKAGAKASKKAAAKSPVKRFRALVERGEGSVCAITINFDVEKTFGARGRVPVRGTLNGAPYRGSLFPMGGCHFMVVNRFLREAAGVTGGETVPVQMERDDEPRVIAPPADLARALKTNREAQATWDKLSYTHRREHVEHIEDAKKPETRQRRIEKSVAALAAGRKEPR